MRIVVYGVGAIGGTIAAALVRSDQDVIGIARGAQLAAIRDRGLMLRVPGRAEVAHFPCAAHPLEIDFRPDDVILLTMKSQDTVEALEDLRAAGVRSQAIFCAQNGVANEPFALRRFPNVHGVTVMMPATFTIPGEVAAFSTPKHGIFDIGRYPSGHDGDDEALAECLERAEIAAFVTDDVMVGKYGKLMINLRNIVDAALGRKPEHDHYADRIRAEARDVLAAAGIPWRSVGEGDARREALIRQESIEGVTRIGGSSIQSLARGAGSIETDYLNGEIVLLGRLHGVPTPVNAGFLELGARLVRERLAPGALSVDEVEKTLRQYQ